MKTFDFDREEAEIFVAQKKQLIGEFLEKRKELRSALDIGVGVGKFSDFLTKQNLKVIGIEGRESNVTEAKKRYPAIPFIVGDAENFGSNDIEPADIVFALGLIYHLENPIRALKNLYALTGKILYVESMILPGEPKPIALLADEGQTESQGLNYRAFIPSENCLVKMLRIAGFKLVYKQNPPPEFIQAFPRNRTILVASKTELNGPNLKKMSAVRSPKPNPYPPFALRLKTIGKKLISSDLWRSWDVF